MNLRNLTGLALLSIVLGSIPLSSQPTVARDRIARGSFQCVEYQGKTQKYIGSPSTVAVNEAGRGAAIIVWERSLGGYAPQERCNKVTEKFKLNLRNGNLVYLVPGYAKRKSLQVVCASRTPTSAYIQCNDEQIILTAAPGDNVQATIDTIEKINRDRTGIPTVQDSPWIQCEKKLQKLDYRTGLYYCPPGVFKILNYQRMAADLQKHDLQQQSRRIIWEN